MATTISSVTLRRMRPASLATETYEVERLSIDAEALTLERSSHLLHVTETVRKNETLSILQLVSPMRQWHKNK